MADADTNQEASQETDKQSIGSKVESELAKVTQQLAEMNARNEEAFRNLAQSIPKKEEPVITDDDIYEPKKVIQAAAKMAKEVVAEERAKDMMIYNLAQDYPEIQTNAEVRKAVIDAQAKLPASLQGTAEGYEMAVLKAVTKAGLVPKSKREVVDPDISAGSGRGTGGKSQNKQKVKVSEKTLAVAALLGRDINDPKVLKGLEEAANRDTFNRYR